MTKDNYPLLLNFKKFLIRIQYQGGEHSYSRVLLVRKIESDLHDITLNASVHFTACHNTQRLTLIKDYAVSASVYKDISTTILCRKCRLRNNYYTQVTTVFDSAILSEMYLFPECLRHILLTKFLGLLKGVVSFMWRKRGDTANFLPQRMRSFVFSICLETLPGRQVLLFPETQALTVNLHAHNIPLSVFVLFLVEQYIGFFFTNTKR